MDRERAALRWSAVGNLGFAGLGIGFAWLTGSDAVRLDGFFSLIGFVMALFTIRVAGLDRQPEDEKFQFGYAAFTPLLNTIKGAVTVIVCAYAAAVGIGALLRGGRELNLGYAIAYAATAVVGCFAIAAVQHRAARRTGSPLLDVDARSWTVDGALSSVVLLAFGAAYALRGTGWAHLIPYVDPALVVLMVAVVIRVPLGIVREAVGQLLLIAPDPATQDEIRRRFRESTRGESFAGSSLHMTRVGRIFYVQAFVTVSPDFRLQRVAELDVIRRRVEQAIHAVQPELVVDVLFTEQPA